MKILLCHNHYQQAGGEDQVFEAEAWLLRSRGHDVATFTMHNDQVKGMRRLSLARKTIWNREVYRELSAVIRRERPQLMHCTNIFPLLSPAAYDAARDADVRVVQSLHNFRLTCPKAQFMRNGRVCEDCLGKRFFWPGVVHRCYRDSFAASAVVATMLGVHWAKKTWSRKVDRYIALTEFGRDKFIEAGLPADRIDVKPNFVRDDPGSGEGCGGYAVFVGRLSPEKGIDTLLAAWRKLDSRVPLKIVGDGPLIHDVKSAVAEDPAIEMVGWQQHDEVLRMMGDARLLVFPSNWYETFGLTIVEAFAKGTPVVASQLGAPNELIQDGSTGLKFDPASPDDLAAQVLRIWEDDDLASGMRENARNDFLEKYTANRNYELLMDIYQHALDPAARPQHQVAER